MSSFVSVVGVFSLSIMLAYGFLRLKCRGIAPPFGPHARPWALLIVLGTAVVSVGVGLLIAAASGYVGAVYAGILVPFGLWFPRLPPQDLGLRTLGAWLRLPFSRLYDRMGDDMQDWCGTRLQAASAEPQWIADAVNYYYDQVQGRLKDDQVRANLDGFRGSITHKISIVRLISLGTTSAWLQTSLQMHSSTRDTRRYSDNDLPLLAQRLESDALQELDLFLTLVYRLGYSQLLVFPF
jgi:hypothetical protein